MNKDFLLPCSMTKGQFSNENGRFSQRMTHKRGRRNKSWWTQSWPRRVMRAQFRSKKCRCAEISKVDTTRNLHDMTTTLSCWTVLNFSWNPPRMCFFLMKWPFFNMHHQLVGSSPSARTPRWQHWQVWQHWRELCFGVYLGVARWFKICDINPKKLRFMVLKTLVHRDL